MPWFNYVHTVLHTSSVMIFRVERSRAIRLAMILLPASSQFQCQSSLSGLDKAQTRLHGLVDYLFFTLHTFSHKRNFASLWIFNHYFHDWCSDRFTARTRLSMYTELTHPHPLRIPLVRRKSHSDTFFPRTLTLWNWWARGCFPQSNAIYILIKNISYSPHTTTTHLLVQ